MFIEDPNYHYEYFMLEKNGTETRLSKEEYDEIYTAYKNSQPNDLIELRNGIISFNQIVKLFFLRNKK